VPEIGIEDNFFALRGHSLLAMRLISRIYDAFQIEIPLSRLFASPTIAGLSAAIEEAILTEIEALSEEEAQRQANRSATQRFEQVF
jgi:acyl carrier protein